MRFCIFLALLSIPAGKSWWAHVQYLASDQLAGRETGSKGYEAAADYVSDARNG